MVRKTQLDNATMVKLIQWLNKILDNGYTFKDVITEIKYAERMGCDIRWKSFSKRKAVNGDINLLKSGTRYYHKELLKMSGVPVVDHDVDKDTLVSRSEQFFTEPLASYTLNDYIKYFCSKINPNMQQFTYNRFVGFFSSMMNTFSIDTMLFIVEAIAHNKEKCGDNFTFDGMRDYNMTAQKYISDIKQNCAEAGGDSYVYRRYL